MYSIYNTKWIWVHVHVHVYMQRIADCVGYVYTCTCIYVSMYICVGHASGMCCVSLIVTYIRVCIICIDFGARPNALACIFLVVYRHLHYM